MGKYEVISTASPALVMNLFKLDHKVGSTLSNNLVSLLGKGKNGLFAVTRVNLNLLGALDLLG
jgi:hypothetical protein